VRTLEALRGLVACTFVCTFGVYECLVYYNPGCASVRDAVRILLMYTAQSSASTRVALSVALAALCGPGRGLETDGGVRPLGRILLSGVRFLPVERWAYL
jgi:hypothetical protein